VLITGAASGIGAHLTKALIARGFRTAAADIDQAGLEATLGSTPPDTAFGLPLDVRKPEAWQAAVDQIVERWGSIDVLLNVSGVLRPGFVHESKAEDVDFQIDVNTKGTIYGCQIVVRQMVAQGAGHLINMASLAGVSPVPGLNLYCASKYAVRGFSLSIAQELAPHGVAVSVVCPDAVQTPMLDAQVDHEEAALTFSGKSSPLTVDDIAAVVLDRVLVDKPMEVAVPFSRGVLARAANLFPGAAGKLVPLLKKKGMARQARRSSK